MFKVFHSACASFIRSYFNQKIKIGNDGQEPIKSQQMALRAVPNTRLSIINVQICGPHTTTPLWAPTHTQNHKITKSNGKSLRWSHLLPTLWLSPWPGHRVLRPPTLLALSLGNRPPQKDDEPLCGPPMFVLSSLDARDTGPHMQPSDLPRRNTFVPLIMSSTNARPRMTTQLSHRCLGFQRAFYYFMLQKQPLLCFFPQKITSKLERVIWSFYKFSNKTKRRYIHAPCVHLVSWMG